MSVVANVAINIDGKQAESLLKSIQSEVEKLNGSFGKLEKPAKGFGAKIKEAAGSVIGQLAAVTGAAFTLQKAFNVLAEQSKAEAALRSLGVNADVASGQFVKLSRELQGQASSVELTAAAYDVASAGFTNVADQTKILGAATKGAVGGMSDLNTVGNATTSVLNAYGMSADKADKLIDGFIQTQNDGKIILAEYATQIGRLAPTAAAAGVGIDELNAAVSTITAQGVPVEATFTGLNQALVSILKPSKNAEDLARSLGIEFNETGLRTKGFGGLLQEVAQKTGGSTTKLTELFGSVDALKAILPLVNDNLVGFNKNLNNQQNSAGAADKAFKDMSNTIQGAFKQLESSFVALIVAFKPVTPAITEPIKLLAFTLTTVADNIKSVAVAATFLGTFALIINGAAIATKAWAIATAGLAAAKKAAGIASAFLLGLTGKGLVLVGAAALAAGAAAVAVAVAMNGAEKEMGDVAEKQKEIDGLAASTADEFKSMPDEINKATEALSPMNAALEASVAALQAQQSALSAQAETAGRVVSIVGAQLGVEKQHNNLQKVRLEREYELATTANKRRDIAIQMFNNAVNAAKIEYQQALANIALEQRKAEIQLQQSILKGKQILAEGQLQILQAGSVEEENKKRQALGLALAAQNDVIKASAEQVATQKIIGQYASQTADAQYETAVQTAGIGLAQKLVSKEIGFTNTQANNLSNSLVAGATSTQAMGNAAGELQTRLNNASNEIKAGTDAAMQGVEQFSAGAVAAGESTDEWRKRVLSGIGAQTQLVASAKSTGSQVAGEYNKTAQAADTANAATIKSSQTASGEIIKNNGFTVERLQKNWNTLAQALPGVMNTMAKTIGNIFTGIGSAIRAVLNSVLRGVFGAVNGAIDNINRLIRAANGISSKVGGPQFTELGKLNIPQFANGGIVTKPTLAMVGEGGEPEYIIPESKMAAAAANYLGGARGASVIPSGNAQINVTTGPVMQQGGQQYVSMADLEKAMRKTADGVYASLRTPAGRYAMGVR